MIDGDADTIRGITDHLEPFIGAPAWVLHEIDSTWVHVDVHVVPPTPKRACWTLFTTGMSDRAMRLPAGEDGADRAELLISLPSDWRVDPEMLRDERWGWPVRWLRRLARLPHACRTWLGPDQLVPNGDPPRPFAAGTSFVCMRVAWPKSLPVEARFATLPGDRRVAIYALHPLYEEEMNLLIDQRTCAACRTLGEVVLDDVADPSRESRGAGDGFFVDVDES